MIWQERSNIIVVITNMVEDGRQFTSKSRLIPSRTRERNIKYAFCP
ncbi:hypothetical protein OESDEN_24082 [Oesophagostomum dentatum]|uniref:Uncharacterized protein n=1 Tax=Oesophagostomum dentatum TaxID=61180 RepID=A0A0B1RT95_OESDE|nr:hypothetical protein OESDEN_24082 [Oesophagostomum dentatum]